MADGAPLLKYYPERSVDDAISLHLLETDFDNAVLLSIPLNLITVLFLSASLTSLSLLSLFPKQYPLVLYWQGWQNHSIYSITHLYTSCGLGQCH